MRHLFVSRALREIQKSMREKGSKCATFAQNHNIWTHCSALFFQVLCALFPFCQAALLFSLLLVLAAAERESAAAAAAAAAAAYGRKDRKRNEDDDGHPDATGIHHSHLGLGVSFTYTTLIHDYLRTPRPGQSAPPAPLKGPFSNACPPLWSSGMSVAARSHEQRADAGGPAEHDYVIQSI